MALINKGAVICYAAFYPVAFSRLEVAINHRRVNRRIYESGLRRIVSAVRGWLKCHLYLTG